MQCHLIEINVRFFTHDECQNSFDVFNSFDVSLLLGGEMIPIYHLSIPPLDSVLQIEHAELVASDVDVELLFD